MRAHNDNNVYIIGAGFSAEAGLPTIPSFLSSMRDAVDWLAATGQNNECAAIERVLDFRHRSAIAGYRTSIDLDNVEHLFSLAEAYGSSASRDDIQIAIASTIDFAAAHGEHPRVLFRVDPTKEWFVTKRWRESAARVTEMGGGPLEVVGSAYDYCAAVMSGLISNVADRGRNTIISLNYDLLLEESFRRLGVGVEYGFGEGVEIEADPDAEKAHAAPVALYKLHGSLNWGVSKPPGSAVVVCADYERVRELGLSPMLMAPTWRKAAWNAFADVWDGAVRAIEAATRIVIIGFSIPATDQHFKYLLSACLGANSSLRSINIVDPSCQLLQHHYESVFRADQFKYGIISSCPMRCIDYFHDSSELGRIRRLPRHPGLIGVWDYRGRNV